MSIVFMDSFDHYATGDINEKWTTSSFNGINASYGRNSTAGARFITYQNYLSKTIANTATFCVGSWRSFVGAFDTTERVMIAAYDGVTIQIDVRPLNTGELRVTRNGTSLGVTSGLGLTTSQYFIEFSGTIHPSAGSFDLRVNGVSVLSASGINTRASANSYINNIYLAGIGSSGVVSYIDDVYIKNDTTPLGDCKVKCVFPDADGNYTDWTASASTDVSCVDETTPNDDTDYISSSTAAQKDTFSFGAVGVTGNVKAVQLNIIARKDDAGSRSIRETCRVNSTDYTGATQSVGDTYLYYREIRETDPNTAAAWTVSGIDNAEFGVELVS